MSDCYERPAKRLKFDDSSSLDLDWPNSVDQIHQWTEFQQSTDPAIKAGINQFKCYLSNIADLDSTAQQSTQFRLLRDYCQWQKSTSEDQVDFHDLLSTWSFATDNNAEAIISIVASALAQFLRTISSSIELRGFGLALIDSLLRRDQSKLFEKCLASPRTKPHLASPCLRLLTEMISFDAGARANEFWYRRDLIMHKFEAVLESQGSSSSAEERKRPSVRRMGLRLLLAMLKYLDATAKTDLISQARVLHSCLKGLLQDGDDIVVELLQAISKHIIDQDGISRTVIVRFFNSAHLDMLAALYRFEIDDSDDANDSVRQAVHNILIKLCTSASGVVISQHGWYPPSLSTQNLEASENDYIDLGIDSPFYFDDYKDKVPVANTVLSMFINKLKPHEDSLQSSLLLDILRAVPELVAEYFSKHKNLPGPSSDDVCWRSQFAFLFSVLELQIPKHLGRLDGQPRTPPPLTIVIESIIPRPLDRAYITRMLTAQDHVLKISAVRLVILALKKLGDVLSAFTDRSVTNTYLWQQAANRISELVEARLPTIRELTLTLQRVPGENSSVRSSLLECLLGFYTTFPNSSTIINYDVSPMMAELCKVLDTQADNRDALLQQLSHCVQIAEVSSSTKWLHKADSDSLSPLMKLLKLCITSKVSHTRQQILSVIHDTLKHRGLISTSGASFAAFCTSIAKSKNSAPSVELFIFIDNCVTRANAKPVKYLDLMENTSLLVSDKKPLSLLIGAIEEQWRFALKRYEGKKSAVKNLATWTARFFALLDAAGENYRVLNHFQDSMIDGSVGKPQEYLREAFDKVRKKPLTISAEWYSVRGSSANVQTMNSETENGKIDPSEELAVLVSKIVPAPESLRGLDKWPTEFDLEFEINTQRLQKLVMCVSAPDSEVRLQALHIIQHVTHTIDTSSSYEGKQQVFLLLGELCDTIVRYGQERPMPTIVPELSNALLAIIIQPTSSLFAKLNKFLLHKPSWSPKGVVMYWLEDVFRRVPDSDDEEAWSREHEWLLQVFLSSLRSQEDLQLYRRCDLWEHLLSFYASPCVSDLNKRLVLALLWQAFRINGGADMLWTRYGVHSWLLAMEGDGGEYEPLIRTIRQKMEGVCNQEQIDGWKAAVPLTKSKADLRVGASRT